MGDADDYAELLALSKSGSVVEEPASLLTPLKMRGAGALEVDDSDPAKQICSCNAVSRGDLETFIQATGEETTYAEIKKCTKAGSGCGGCEPDVKKILKSELEKMGATVNNNLCAHFDYSRPELVAKIRLDEQNFKSFDEVLAAAIKVGGPHLIEIDMEHFEAMEISIMPKKNRDMAISERQA